MITSPDLLPEAALEVARQIHEGKWRHVLDRESQPAADSEAIIAELRSRCPGLERSAYRDALVIGIAQIQTLPAPTPRQNLVYWGVAFTFAWGLIVIRPFQKEFYLGLYTVVCGLAALYLFRQRRSGSVFLAVINLLGGLVWIAILIWVMMAFAAHRGK